MCKAGKYKKYAFAADTCVLESPISIILLKEKKYLNIIHFETKFSGMSQHTINQVLMLYIIILIYIIYFI